MSCRRGVLLGAGLTITPIMLCAGAYDSYVSIERHGKPVDLLVTDVVMSGMSGRELAQALLLKLREVLDGRKLRPKLPLN